MATLITAIILVIVVALAILGMVKRKKDGKSLSCGGNCKACASNSLCHKKENEKNTHQDYIN